METLLLKSPTPPTFAGQRMSKAEFMRWESDDAFVYEFSDGVLESTLSMKQEEMYLLGNLEAAFSQTEAFKQGGRLRAEVDCWLTETQMRRPDVAYFTKDQLRQAAQGEAVIPAFVVEFISEHDEILKGERKRNDHFQAGVAVLWWVLPPSRTVYVYKSPKMAEICGGDDPLGAGSVLPDLKLTAEALFVV